MWWQRGRRERSGGEGGKERKRERKGDKCNWLGKGVRVRACVRVRVVECTKGQALRWRGMNDRVGCRSGRAARASPCLPVMLILHRWRLHRPSEGYAYHKEITAFQGMQMTTFAKA